jgi:predicted nucleic acid-binding protein
LPRRAARPPSSRYTIDASVFVNAFNPHEHGHADSLAFLNDIHERSVPVILPALVLTEVASAIARATDDDVGAIEFASTLAGLPHVTIVALTAAVAREAAQLAAMHRLRGADAVYAAIARRYATTLVTRDEQQRQRASDVVPCLTPQEALDRRA